MASTLDSNPNQTGKKTHWIGQWLTIIALLWVVFSWAMPLLTVLMVSLLLAYLLETPVQWLTQASGMIFPKWLGPRRWIAVTLATMAFILMTSLTTLWLVPLLSKQLTAFIEALPNYLALLDSEITHVFHIAPKWVQTLSPSTGLMPETPTPSSTIHLASWLSSGLQKFVIWAEGTSSTWVSSAGTFLNSTLEGLVAVLATLVLVYQFLLHGGRLQATCVRMMPVGSRRAAHDFLRKLHKVMRAFVLGQVMLGAFTGLYMIIVYSVFDVPYGVLLGVFFGFADVIPVIGTYLGITPGLLVVLLSKSPMTLLWVWLSSYCYQSIKDNIISPKIMGDVLGLHPVATVLALMVGLQLAGLAGLIAAIPVLAMIRLYRLEPPGAAIQKNLG
jgi:predicted PurR-regulated permease PerM